MLLTLRLLVWHFACLSAPTRTSMPSDSIKPQPSNDVHPLQNLCTPGHEQASSFKATTFLDDCPDDVPMNRGPSAEANEPIWKMYNDEAARVDSSMIEDWNKGLDNLLIFTGLFSAILTAFVVAAYPSLQPDNTQAMVDALTLISKHLVDLSSSSAPSAPFRRSETVAPSTAALWISGLWFASLVLSLTASLSVIVVQQWIRDYPKRVISGRSENDRCIDRQVRFEGVVRWRMSSIISALPLIVQFAVLLFFAGLGVFTWNIHVVLGKIVIALISTTAVAYITATLLPLFFKGCPYKSTITRFLLAVIDEGDQRLKIRYFPELIPKSDFRKIETRALAWLMAAVVDSEVLKAAILALAGYGIREEILKDVERATAVRGAIRRVRAEQARSLVACNRNNWTKTLPEATGVWSAALLYEENLKWLDRCQPYRSLKEPARRMYMYFRRKAFNFSFSDMAEAAKEHSLSCNSSPSGLLSRLLVLYMTDLDVPTHAAIPTVSTPLIQSCIEGLRSDTISLYGASLFFHYMASVDREDMACADRNNPEERILLLQVVHRWIFRPDMTYGAPGPRNEQAWPAGLERLPLDVVRRWGLPWVPPATMDHSDEEENHGTSAGVGVVGLPSSDGQADLHNTTLQRGVRSNIHARDGSVAGDGVPEPLRKALIHWYTGKHPADAESWDWSALCSNIRAEYQRYERARTSLQAQG